MKEIYTVIPYFNSSLEVNLNYIESFGSYELAEEYTWYLKGSGILVSEIIKNKLNL